MIRLKIVSVSFDSTDQNNSIVLGVQKFTTVAKGSENTFHYESYSGGEFTPSTSKYTYKKATSSKTTKKEWAKPTLSILIRRNYGKEKDYRLNRRNDKRISC